MDGVIVGEDGGGDDNEMVDVALYRTEGCLECFEKELRQYLQVWFVSIRRCYEESIGNSETWHR